MAKTLLQILEENGVNPFESGDRWLAHCPFHDGDREPSFTIYDNESYFCFGCKEWGNPVRFMIRFKGMSAQEALDYVGVEDYVFPKTEKRAIKVKNLFKSCKFLYEVAETYHKYLLQNKGPQKYLEDRGLTPDTIKKFKIGYTDGAVLSLQFAEEYEMANEIGILNKSGYESMAHRITIPNLLDDKYADFMIGRTVINDKIKYLGARMPKPICGFYEQRNSPILFLVEGNFDYLILRQWGYPAIVMSGSHITKSNYALLRDKIVIIVPDNDEVGVKSAKEIKKTLPSSRLVDYSSLGVKDIGELAPQEGAKERFDALVGEQLWDILSIHSGLAKYLPTSLGLIRLP